MDGAAKEKCSAEKKAAKKAKKQRTESSGASSSTAAPAPTPASAPAPAAMVAGSPARAAPAPAIPTEETLPHLACTVCLSFPEKDVLQCNAGHIMCRTCYEQVLHQERPTCPTCRDVLDTTKEVRNTLAEQTIAMLPVECPNAPCAVALTRGTLEKHLACECAYRPVCCKYSVLGCKWEGVASGLAAHEEKCKRAEMPGWKLLEKVKAKNDEVAAEHRAELAERAKERRVVEALSSRCRNVELSHVVLHKCSSHEHIAGKPAHLVSATFHAVGCRWKVYTFIDPGPGTYCAVVQLRDDMRQQMPVEVFVLRGPGGTGDGTGMRPASISQTFSGASRQRSTEPMVLAHGAAADALEKEEKLELRIGLVDRRVGRIVSTFAGHISRGILNGEHASEEEDWGDEEGDMDDDGEEGSEGEFSDGGSDGGYRGGFPHHHFY